MPATVLYCEATHTNMYYETGVHKEFVKNIQCPSRRRTMNNPKLKRSTIRITNLALRAIIGINDWERKKMQDIVINVSLDFDAAPAVKSDSLQDTLDYKKIKRDIINFVEKSRFKLLETLTGRILGLAMKNPKVFAATIRIDKPHALRFADSVSVEMSAERDS